VSSASAKKALTGSFLFCSWLDPTRLIALGQASLREKPHQPYGVGGAPTADLWCD